MADASAIKAGEAYVSITSRDAALTKGLQRAQAKLASWGQAVNALGQLALSKAGFSAVRQTLDAFAASGSQLSDMSARTGVSVERLSELGYAARTGGDSLEGVEGVIRHLQKTLADAADGGGEAVEAFTKLGLSVSALGRMKGDEQLRAVAAALGKIENDARRSQLAMALLGKEGNKAWGKGLEDAIKKARELGLVISTDMAEKASALGSAFETLKMAGERSLTGIGAALAPTATAVAEGFAKVMKGVNEWIDKNPAVVQAAAGFSLGLGGAGAALLGLSGGLKLLDLALSGPMAILKVAGSLGGAAVGAFTGLAGALLSLVPFAVPLAAIGLAVYSILHSTGQLDRVSGAIGGAFSKGWSLAGRGVAELRRVFGEATSFMASAWQGVVNAIAAGDFTLAGQIAMLSLKVAWLATVDYMKDRWTQFGDWFASSFGTTLENLWADMKVGAVRTIEFIQEKLRRLSAGWDWLKNLLSGGPPEGASPQFGLLKWLGGFFPGASPSGSGPGGGGGGAPGWMASVNGYLERLLPSHWASQLFGNWNAAGGSGGIATQFFNWLSGASPDVAAANLAQQVNGQQQAGDQANKKLADDLKRIADAANAAVAGINAGRATTQAAVNAAALVGRAFASPLGAAGAAAQSSPDSRRVSDLDLALLDLRTAIVNAEIAAEEARKGREQDANGQGPLGGTGQAAGTFSAVAAAGLAGSGFQRQLLSQGQQGNAFLQQIAQTVANIGPGVGVVFQ